MRSNVVILGGLFLLVAIVIATLNPERLKIKADKKLVTHHGIVAEVYETALKDLVVKLQGSGESYYIKGKTEEGITFDQLKDRLMNKPVEIQYLERWKPVPDQEPKHYVSKLEHEGEILFDESKE